MKQTEMSDVWNEEAQKQSTVTTAELDGAVEEYTDARAEYDAKKKISNEASATMMDAKYKLLDLMTLAGKDKYLVDGLGTASKVIKKTAKVPKELGEKIKFLNYFRGLGEDVYNSMVSVNSATLNSFIKEQVEIDPAFEMPGVGELKISEDLRFTKARK